MAVLIRNSDTAEKPRDSIGWARKFRISRY